MCKICIYICIFSHLNNLAKPIFFLFKTCEFVFKAVRPTLSPNWQVWRRIIFKNVEWLRKDGCKYEGLSTFTRSQSLVHFWRGKAVFGLDCWLNSSMDPNRVEKISCHIYFKSCTFLHNGEFPVLSSSLIWLKKYNYISGIILICKKLNYMCSFLVYLLNQSSL